MCADSAKKNRSLCSPAFFAKIVLTKPDKNDILVKRSILSHAGVAQLVEQLICNQQVGGSNPSTSSTLRRSAEPDKLPHLFLIKVNMEEFPSGQRGQTVNLLRYVSVVRIHPPPPYHLENEPHPLGWGSFFYAMLHQNQITRAEMPSLSYAYIHNN